jgi:leucyl-tRNA synthetase
MERKGTTSNYPAQEIERKWQKWWEEIGLFKTKEKGKKKYYILEMFPYPSGGDLHMGHLKNYAIGDVVARIKLMEGYDILHPMGWDAFGLPAENAAIKHGVHPREWTLGNIKAYREHLKLLGISYDWDREIATCDPTYYKWTQWLFLLLYDMGLAYRKEEFVNWCPNCKTVLANEQVVEGKCERCHSPVLKKKLEQWFFKITAYAERLLRDLEKLKGKWPPRIIKQQENWIGKSEGTLINFELEEGNIQLPVFTTRADTLFGVTFLTIAPEHPILEKIIGKLPNKKEVKRYIEGALLRSEAERLSVEREKTGVFTGLYAIHPMTGEKLPLWVGDYVLVGYGTGIVMGVPAHDQRDFEFAKKYDLPIKVVIKPVDGELPDELEEAYEEYGVMINSGPFSELESLKGIEKLEKYLEEKDLGGHSVSYRIRDWLISRQRYWGAPIPIIHCPSCGIVPVPKEELPVKLPEKIKDFLPKGRSPLEDVPEFMNTSCPRCGGSARRDPDTMDTFVDSSWYFLRYIDPKNEEKPFSTELVNRWMPVDQYIGGAEHATKHLIYARFIQKVLYDAGLVSQDEPFLHLFTQGLVLMKTKDGTVEMMSKSRGNFVPVGPFVEKYGADVARVTILFAAPPEKDFEWTDEGVTGARRFIQRVYRLYQDTPLKGRESFDRSFLSGSEKELYIRLNQTINEVRRDFKEFHFNTALARIMELLNDLYSFEEKESPVYSYALEKLVLLLAPLTPHLAEELWHILGHQNSVFQNSLPDPDPDFLYHEEIEIPIQINGKLRGRVKVLRDSSEEDVLEKALNDEKIKKYIDEKRIKRVIYIKNRLLNIVVT